MAGQDGIDPLDSAHVQEKTRPDVRVGNILFSNGAPVLTGSTVKLPVMLRFTPIGGIPVRAHSQVFTIPYGMPLLAAPPVRSIQSGVSNEGIYTPDTSSLKSFSAFLDQAVNSYNNARSIGLEIQPFNAGNILVTSMTDTGPASINVGDASTFADIIAEQGYGWIDIGGEIMQFTGTTATNLTGINGRGSFGTAAVYHFPGALVRLLSSGWYFEGQILLSGF